MTSTPSVWMEARCASVCANLGDNWGLPEHCHQTAQEGGFFSAIRPARRHFEAQGWHVRDGEWWCPVCYRLRYGGGG